MAKKQFKTPQELESYVKGRMEDAMDEVYDKLLDKLIEFIKRDVYGVPDPKFYIRTYDLLDKKNWEIKRYISHGKIYRNLYFKGENLTEPFDKPPHSYSIYNDPSSYTHGNYMETFSADNFMKMLNNEIRQGDAFGFPQVDRRPFWDDFMTYCDKNYSKLFINACKRNGIELK